jgi:hypothetical protein
VNGALLLAENEAILIVKFLIIFEEIKRPVKKNYEISEIDQTSLNYRALPTV